MAAAQRTVTQLEPVFKNIPEFFDVAAGGQRDIGQIDGHDALIEAAVILVLARLVVAGVGDVAHARVGEAVGREEAAAAHAGIHVALELEHFLFADVIGHHTARRAFCGKLCEIIVGRILVDVVLLERVDELGERGRDPHALLVLHTLVALEQHLLDDEGKVLLFLLASRLVEVHEDGDEGGLSVRREERDDLILDRLHAAADLLADAVFDQLCQLLLARMRVDGLHLGRDLAADALAADLHERRQMRQRDRLPAVLVGSHLSDDLSGNVAGGGEAVGPLDQGVRDDGAVLKHILQIHQVTVVHVLGVVVRVMEVDDALPMGLHDVGGQQQSLAQVPGDLAGHVVPLGGVHHRVLVGVLLLGLLVAALDEAEDLLVGGIALADQRADIAVGDVVLGHLIGPVSHDLGLHQVLNLLHRGGAVHLLTAEFHGLRDPLDLDRGHPGVLLDSVVGLGDGGDDLRDVEDDLRAVPLHDFHGTLRLSCRINLNCNISSKHCYHTTLDMG